MIKGLGLGPKIELVISFILTAIVRICRTVKCEVPFRKSDLSVPLSKDL